MNSYETVFVLTPDLAPAEAKEAMDRFTAVLTDAKAEIVNAEEWGLKQLAYPIGRKTNGFYYLVEFNAEPSTVDTLETELRRTESVLRFLTVALDKHALEYNRRRRNGEFGKKKKTNVKEGTVA